MREFTEKQKLYQEFLATPSKFRKIRFGTDSKSEFAKEVLGVHPNTAYNWTKLPNWSESVNQLAVLAQHHRLGDLYEAIFDKAINDKDVKAMRLAAELGNNMLNSIKVEDNTVSANKIQATAEEKLAQRAAEIMRLALKMREENINQISGDDVLQGFIQKVEDERN